MYCTLHVSVSPHLCFQVLLSVTLKWSSLCSNHCSLGRGRPLGGGARRPCRCLEAAEAKVMEVTSISVDTNMLDTLCLVPIPRILVGFKELLTFKFWILLKVGFRISSYFSNNLVGVAFPDAR